MSFLVPQSTVWLWGPVCVVGTGGAALPTVCTVHRYFSNCPVLPDPCHVTGYFFLWVTDCCCTGGRALSEGWCYGKGKRHHLLPE